MSIPADATEKFLAVALLKRTIGLFPTGTLWIRRAGAVVPISLLLPFFCLRDFTLTFFILIIIKVAR